ncbi:amidohydrolase [Thermobrachium celere]|uniref:amidohydrolase n=1 Tax=Thermobrachium celere TaxID=53422 RepID=UPI0019458887|nr:amidohydrolase [Thermobrachium celere]GFR34820.1 amidohydrolase [Thermobrachium celere]
MSGIIITNAKIYTMDDEENVFSSMYINEGKIVELSNENLIDKYRDCEVIDLNNRAVFPGFIESHMHLIEAARSMVEMDFKNVKNKEDFEHALYSFSRTKENDSWIMGSGWSEIVFGGVMPHRVDIDRIVNDKPVCLIRQDGHSLILNTRALEVLNLKEDENVLNSKAAVKDEEGLTGLFYEEWVFDIIGRIMDKMPDIYYEIALSRVDSELIKNGVTMINDIMTQYPRYYNTYKRLQKEGKLKVRIIAGSLGGSKEYEEFNKLEETDKLRKGPVKYFVDGSFGSRTALLMEPYEDDPSNRGCQNLTDEEIYSIIEDSLKNNIPLAVHVIGDLAMKKFLDIYERVYEKYPNNKVRNRVEHIQIIQEDDIDRFKRLNLIASFQPIFNLESNLTLTRLGFKRIKDTYRYRTFIDRGIMVIFNSDTPFGAEYMPKKDGTFFKGFEPMLGIHCAVNKLNLNIEERVTVNQAVVCYTKNPAFANYMEDVYGTLEKGKYADFVVLEEDIFNIDTLKIKDVEVYMTVIGGEIVYKK